MQEILHTGEYEPGFCGLGQASTGYGSPQPCVVQRLGQEEAVVVAAAEDSDIAGPGRAGCFLAFGQHVDGAGQEIGQGMCHAVFHPGFTGCAFALIGITGQKIEFPQEEGIFHLGGVLGARPAGFQGDLVFGELGECPAEDSICSMDEVFAGSPGAGLYILVPYTARMLDDGLHQFRCCSAEAVDRLLGVADPYRVLSEFRQFEEEFQLEGAGVLEFVHQE